MSLKFPTRQCFLLPLPRSLCVVYHCSLLSAFSITLYAHPMANGIRVVGEVQVPACLRSAKWSSSLRRSLSVTSSSTDGPGKILLLHCHCSAA